MSRAVTVAVRTRPTAVFAQDQVVLDLEKHSIAVKAVVEAAAGAPSNKQESFAWRFHDILHNAGQDTVYDTLCSEIVSSAVSGTNATIMAYGQTGAGKTFTMIGDTRNFKFRGVAPRAIAQVFAEIGEHPEKEFSVGVSYMEIYNERIFDLLAPADAVGEFQVVEDRVKGTVVRGLSVHEVGSEEETLNMLFRGEANRTTAEHLLNKDSNRSHCIFTVHLSQRARLGTHAAKVLFSKLNLVDLAGSERIKKTMAEAGGSDDVIQRESMYINKSLSYLEQVVVALTTKSRAHVPYRQTKLTHVLKDSLGGNCRTVFIACVWCESRHIEETISTLRLANRMMRVHNEASVNVETDPVLLVKKYEKQIKELKQELAMHDALVDRSGVAYEEYTPEQQDALKQELLSFLREERGEDGEPVVVELDSVRKMQEILKQVKVLFRNLEIEAAEGSRGRLGGVPGIEGGRGGAVGGAGGSATDAGGHDGVGDLEGGGGFGLGLAPAHARPVGGIESRSPGYGGSPAGGKDFFSSTSESKLDTDEVPRDKKSAFLLYRSRGDLGQPLTEAVAAAKEGLRARKADLKGVSAVVNSAKSRIDDLQAALDSKRGTKGPLPVAGAAEDETVVDEEEYRLIKDISEEKKKYRVLFGQLRDAKSAVAEASDEVERAQLSLAAAFDEWWLANAPAEAKGGPDFDEHGDALDVGEAFERLEMEKVAAEDPDSLAYFNAQKKMGASLKAPAGKRATKRV